ncbi:MAG: hypothetical protein HY907_20660 [Deltaproteobacteria bacterium]|nr:hypothetical protein [Deltaproteobacteria bacterium]
MTPPRPTPTTDLAVVPVGLNLGRLVAAGALAVLFIIATLAYRSYFEVEIGNSAVPRWGMLATRTYLPDSDGYMSLYAHQDISLWSVTHDILTGTNPNLYGISAVAHILTEWEIEPVFFNMALILLTAGILWAFARQVNVSPLGALVLLLANPSTIYYAQTITKEIVAVALTTLYFLAMLRRKNRKWRITLWLVTALMTLIRVHFGLGMLLGILLVSARQKRQRLWFLAGAVAVAAVMPLLYSEDVVRAQAAENYRAEAPSATGVGNLIDQGLRDVPLSGLAFIPVRALQDATEPFPKVLSLDIRMNSVSVYSLIVIASFFIAIRWVVEFTLIGARFLAGRLTGSAATMETVVLILTLWGLVACIAWVHSRYLFPVLPMFGLGCAMVQRESRERDERPGMMRWATAIWVAAVAVYAVQVGGALMSWR